MRADAPARILIVDDEPFNVDLLEQELADLGYATLTAQNGQQAVEVARAEAPDLVLLDVMMPVMDGFEACRVLKEDEATRLTPVIIMTALDRVEDRIKGIEAGADDFLTKPVNDAELLARIRTALKTKAAVDARVGEATRLRDHFAKFVPESVRRLAVTDGATLEGKVERDVTVLMLDITGYSALSETVPVERLNALIERYFSAYLDCIREADGDINETAGDGFMAVFMEHDHAGAAVAAALHLLQITEQLNADSEAEPLSVHIGVNSGAALVGASRFEGERATRWTFTASGPVTNLAARLVGVARASQAVIGPETRQRVGDRFQLEALGAQSLKNLSEPVEVHRVVGTA